MYSEELFKARCLKAELEALVRDLTELHPEYPMFAEMVACLLIGSSFRIIVPCEDSEDGECTIEGQEPVGGLWESYRNLVEVVESLELELQYEEESAPEPYIGPEYEI